MSPSLQKLTARLSAASVLFAQKQVIAERVEKEYKELNDKIDADTTDARNRRDAHLLTLAYVSARRESAISSFEKIGTYGLRAIYGDDYKVHFLRNEEKKNAAAFKMEIGVESKYNSETLITGLGGERGGGVIESASVSFRFGAWDILGYNGPGMLDETWKSLSSDEKIENSAKFMSAYTKSSNRQILFSSHKADTFSKYADHIVYVSKENGVSEVNYE